MNIKEVEERCGMARANIRFYEAEGLLSPRRSENGYRDYSEQDVEELQRIRLLRALHLPLEEIKKLRSGTLELSAALSAQLSSLEQEREELSRSQRVCREICEDGAHYSTLDAQRYLDSLSRTASPAPAVPEDDVLPPVRCPWRRFFARFLDYTLYNTLWQVFLTVVCNVNTDGRTLLGRLLDIAVTLVLMVLIEPLFLCYLGTTPGKWLLGLRLTADGEMYLSYVDAMNRTGGVILHGMGLQIPFFNLYRMWKSRRICEEGGTLDWEYDSQLTLEARRRNIPLYLCAHALLLGVILLASLSAQMPRARGDITVAQFAQNYNRLSSYLVPDQSHRLNGEGLWVNDNQGYAVLSAGACPAFVYEERDGVLTAVSFSYISRDAFSFQPDFRTQMQLTALAFGCTAPGMGAFSSARQEMLTVIRDHPFESFSYSDRGVTMECVTDYQGFVPSDFGLLYSYSIGSDPSYTFSFRIEKE